MNERYWLFNTDETEEEGEGAYQDMLDLSVIAAWGYCRGTGAKRTLNKPTEGDTVFFFLAGRGIIANGQVERTGLQGNQHLRPGRRVPPHRNRPTDSALPADRR